MTNLRTRLGAIFSSDDVSKAYKLTFRQPSGTRFVLPDLMDYTGVLYPSPPGDNMFDQGRFAGRRDVGLRIVEMLNLSDEEIAATLRGRDILRPEDFQR